MNDTLSHETNPWPAGRSADEERELAAGWQALDRALVDLEGELDSSNVSSRGLSDFRLRMMAAQVERQVSAARRRRVRRLALAASLLVVVAATLWSMPRRTPIEGQKLVGQRPVVQQQRAVAPNEALATGQLELAWNEDGWLADVTSVRRDADAVENGWDVRGESWSEVQDELDELERELSNEVSL
ncbi:MAG: hypothetical protein JSS27_10460 [Planctomycetes bacterium]|nr:hypothetical protein [Planctomycetota bacterium]